MKQSIFHVSIYELIENPRKYNFLTEFSKRFPTLEKAKEYALYQTTDCGNRGYLISEEVYEI